MGQAKPQFGEEFCNQLLGKTLGELGAKGGRERVSRKQWLVRSKEVKFG